MTTQLRNGLRRAEDKTGLCILIDLEYAATRKIGLPHSDQRHGDNNETCVEARVYGSHEVNAGTIGQDHPIRRAKSRPTELNRVMFGVTVKLTIRQELAVFRRSIEAYSLLR